MNDTVLKIAIAGLLHDVGKLAQGGMTLPEGYEVSNQQIYQPSWNGVPSHRHALYTAAFIEGYADRLPAVFNQADWGEGERLDSLINLAACHHKPETPMQQCITQADRLSSGLDRASFTDNKPIPFTEYRSTRLVSVLEALSTDDKQQKKYESSSAYSTCYHLKPLSAENIFPAPKEKIDKKAAMDEYQALFDDFVAKIVELPHKDESISLWAEHFDSLLATYGSQIPAARVGAVIPDVSLYDHCRTTASLAVPLYLYHRDTDTLTVREIDNDAPEKFLLVSGDFYGIQDFIFAAGGENQRLRAKLLRGRSFAVSLISELAANALCRALGLPFTAVFLNAAGKFHLLAANTSTALECIETEAKKLNRWLYEISNGQTSLGVTTTPASPSQFSQGGFVGLWDCHLNNMVSRKHQRLEIDQYGVISDFLNQFNNDLEKKICPFCGKRPSAPETENDAWIEPGVACKICRDHVMLGANLVKGRGLAIFSGPTKGSRHERLLAPIFDQYQLRFCEKTAAIDDGPLIKYWQLDVNGDGSLPAGGTLRLINGYIPTFRAKDLENEALQGTMEKEDEVLANLVSSQAPKTFNALAVLARNGSKGTEALGILKADVDNLGLLISCGMSDERFTLSRMTTLSRKLDQFFSLYLPHLLASHETFKDIYTVFAGGDDLFLIGPWNRMAELAVRLRQEWRRYVSGNDGDGHLTFSAGITLHKTHVPVDRLAEAAEAALEQAKDNGRNSITMFGETVKWDDFVDLLAKKQVMADWLAKEYISNVMLYRFNTFIDMAGKARKIMDGNKAVRLEDMECLKWPALFRYSLERNIRKKGSERDMALQEVVVMKNWLEEQGSALKIALWSQLYEKR